MKISNLVLETGARTCVRLTHQANNFSSVWVSPEPAVPRSTPRAEAKLNGSAHDSRISFHSNELGGF